MKNKWKMLNTSLLFAGLILAIISTFYLTEVCLMIGDCVNYTRRGTWIPLQYSGAFLAFIAIIFLFFPAKYFKRYIIVWFWWLFILAFSIAAATEPLGSSIISFDRSQTVLALGILAIIQAFLFIYITRRKNNKLEVS